MYNTQKAYEAQWKYCQERGFPMFSPGPSGQCYRCGRDIYRRIEWPDGRVTGITVESARNRLITGCPHCNYSFCE